MSIFFIVGLLAIIVSTFIFRNYKRKKAGTDVLESKWLNPDPENNLPASIPKFNYSKWTDDPNLINPVYTKLDSEIEELCEAFRRSDDQKRDHLRQSFNDNEIYTLLEFAKRTTVFCVRNNDPHCIDNGFAAIALIAYDKIDFRDVLMALSFLNYGIQKLQLDGAKIFDQAIRLSDEKMGQLIQKFIDRTPNDKRLETMAGYTVIETIHGSGLVLTNRKSYKPQRDLIDIILQISDYLTSDKYQKGSITVGDSINSIWLNPHNDRKIAKLNSSTTGCVSLETNPKKDFYSRNNFQILYVYLAELNDLENLIVTLEESKNTTADSFSRLSFNEGNLFCLIIQKAIVVGVKSFESNKSLKRLELPIKEIMATGI